MKTAMWCFMCCAAAAVLSPVFADPSITSVSAVQGASGAVTIGYELAGEAAVITVDVQTNGVSIGDANLTHFAGDAFRKVQPGSRAATWMPDKSWPNQNAVEGSLSYVVKAWSLDNPPDYMVVDLVTSNTVNYYLSADQLPDGLSDVKYRTDKLVMRRIPAKDVEWRMGSPSTENGHRNHETAHYVILTNDFYLGVFELTQRQYALVNGSSPTWVRTGDDAPLCPADAVACSTFRGTDNIWPRNGHDVDSDSWLDKVRSLTGVGFDLPTSAQWEFACRAGTGTALYTGEYGDFNEAITNIAWTSLNSSVGTMPVGLLRPNGYGLYDMLGNVWEICLDQCEKNSYYEDSKIEPVGPNQDYSNHVRRGNAANDANVNYYRSAAWHYMSRTAAGSSSNRHGFRLWAPLAQH